MARAKLGRGGDGDKANAPSLPPAAEEALLKSRNILIWGRDEDQQNKEKVPFQSDRADKCHVEEQEGGAVSWLCAWLPGAHTSMHSHSLSLPAHCSPLIPPQPTGGPFIPVLFRSCSLGLDLSLPG